MMMKLKIMMLKKSKWWRRCQWWWRWWWWWRRSRLWCWKEVDENINDNYNDDDDAYLKVMMLKGSRAGGQCITFPSESYCSQLATIIVCAQHWLQRFYLIAFWIYLKLKFCCPLQNHHKYHLDIIPSLTQQTSEKQPLECPYRGRGAGWRAIKGYLQKMSNDKSSLKFPPLNTMYIFIRIKFKWWESCMM